MSKCVPCTGSPYQKKRPFSKEVILPITDADINRLESATRLMAVVDKARETDSEVWMTRAEFQTMIGVSRGMILKLIQKGLPCRRLDPDKPNSPFRFPARQAINWMDARQSMGQFGGNF